ncbi:hypothetical protein [Bacillus safensis]|uniref:hypothetical protein n=1 Tax=Bacillus safensis TaxID=561879 RepID=UPI00366B7816
MKLLKWFGIFVFALILLVVVDKDSVALGATSPYDVDSNVEKNWSNTLGLKNFPQTSGRKLTYDVYSQKYTSGGYRIATKNFGKGSQKYVNFQGWAILDGHKHHTKTNHETYIVAKKVVGKKNIGLTKVYGTIPYKNLSATEDLEYNNKGAGLYNPCPAGATNKNNETDCNMRYENVGFDAFLPLDELFSDKDESASWTLFIVKRVDSHIVYTPLNLPFNFSNKSYGKGDISLSSGIEGGTLQMNSTNVLKRHFPRQLSSDGISGQYFVQYKFYKNVDVDESKTAVWYGVKTPEDDNKVRWANTSYWTFGGRQALLSYRVDSKTTPPPTVCKEPQLPKERYQYEMDFELSEIDGKTVDQNKETTTIVKVKRISYAENREKAKKAIQKDIDSRVQKKAELTEELKKLQSERDQIQKKLDEADGTDDYDKINDLIKQLDNKKQAISNKQCNINTVQTEITHYKKELATLKAVEKDNKSLETNVIIKFDGTQKGESVIKLTENQIKKLSFKWVLTKKGEVVGDVNPKRINIGNVKEATYANNVRSTPIYVSTRYTDVGCLPVVKNNSYAEGVVRTVSSVDGNKVYREKVYTSLEVPEKYKNRRAGYGFDYTVTNKYINEDELSKGKESDNVATFMPTTNPYLPYKEETFSKSSLKLKGYKAPLEKTKTIGEEKERTSEWKLPNYYVEEYSGNVFLDKNHEKRNLEDKLLDGGRKWYLPLDLPDTKYSFQSVTQNVGVNKMNTCVSSVINVEGSIIGDPNGNDDFVKRTITPENPFPAGEGWNWKGNVSKIELLNQWYNNWYNNPAETPSSSYVETFYVTPEVLAKIKQYDQTHPLKAGSSLFDTVSIPRSR